MSNGLGIWEGQELLKVSSRNIKIQAGNKASHLSNRVRVTVHLCAHVLCYKARHDGVSTPVFPMVIPNVERGETLPVQVPARFGHCHLIS